MAHRLFGLLFILDVFDKKDRFDVLLPYIKYHKGDLNIVSELLNTRDSNRYDVWYNMMLNYGIYLPVKNVLIHSDKETSDLIYEIFDILNNYHEKKLNLWYRSCVKCNFNNDMISRIAYLTQILMNQNILSKNDLPFLIAACILNPDIKFKNIDILKPESVVFLYALQNKQYKVCAESKHKYLLLGYLIATQQTEVISFNKDLYKVAMIFNMAPFRVDMLDEKDSAWCRDLQIIDVIVCENDIYNYYLLKFNKFKPAKLPYPDIIKKILKYVLI